MKSNILENNLLGNISDMLNLVCIMSLLLFLLVPFTAFAQENQILKNSRLFLSTSYYDIYEKNIPSVLLDKYIGFIDGIGDKDISKEIILRIWLFDNTLQSSEKPDIKELQNVKIPDLPVGIEGSNDFVRIKKLLRLIFANELLVNSTNFFESTEQIVSKLSLIAPELFEDDIENVLSDNTSFITKYSNYEDEFSALCSFFYQQLPSHQPEDTKAVQLHYIDSIEQQIKERYPLFDLYFSDEGNIESTQEKSVVPTRDQAITDIRGYIEKTYQKLLSRSPTLNELNVWEKNFKDNEMLSPNVLYYILMTSEEYMYF